MSGKSTYLRQIGLLSVMAMCGSFVPAEYASFRIHDFLLSRLSNDDDLEKCLSTFASEMASCAMVLGLATPNSLVLIDELGRGTSPTEGAGIAHAIAEELVALKPFVFFATHFKELTVTLSRQPSVVNLHLSVHRTRQSAFNFGMTFQYKIIDGAPDDSSHYGLELARLADLPTDALAEAKRVADKLAALQAKDEEESESNKIVLRRRALLRVMFYFFLSIPRRDLHVLATDLLFWHRQLRTQLVQALDHSALPDQELREYIRRFQTDIAKAFLHAH